MNAKDAIKTALTGTQGLLSWYLSDLSDEDLLVRPVPGANHIAWQLGHLIFAESHLVREQIPSATYPQLPADYSEKYGAKGSTSDSSFGTKADYLALFNQSREATLAALAKLTDADLDKPTVGGMAKYAPTLAAMFLLVSNHTLMHAGQFTVVRRKLGKPVLF